MSDKCASNIRQVDATALAEAVALLRAGELVALPTETVYGLAARADSESAVAKIYHAKGRPDFNPLIVHVASLEAAENIAQFDDRARALAAAFWPGALTLVLPLKEGAGIAPAVTAGLPTIALRCPAHPVMRTVLAELGAPLAAPSANRSGGVSPSTAAHVAASLGAAVQLILDGGAAAQGIESTIIAIRVSGRTAGWSMLRPGPVTSQQVTEIVGEESDVTASNGVVEAPGQLASHYAPGKPVRLGALTAQADEFHIGFGSVAGAVTLSASGDLAEAASRLYTCLHLAAAAKQTRVAIAPVPHEGIGVAINDRLTRAAA